MHENPYAKPKIQPAAWWFLFLFVWLPYTGSLIRFWAEEDTPARAMLAILGSMIGTATLAYLAITRQRKEKLEEINRDIKLTVKQARDYEKEIVRTLRNLQDKFGEPHDVYTRTIDELP